MERAPVLWVGNKVGPVWQELGKAQKKKRWRGNGRMHQKNREYSLHVSVCLSVCVCVKREKEKGGTNWWNKTWLLLWRCPVEEDHLSCAQRPNHNSRVLPTTHSSQRKNISLARHIWFASFGVVVACHAHLTRRHSPSDLSKKRTKRKEIVKLFAKRNKRDRSLKEKKKTQVTEFVSSAL